MTHRNYNAGRRIKELRKARHLTVQECCEDVGVSYSAWRKYETAERVPRDEIKRKIADYFDRTVQFIFFS